MWIVGAYSCVRFNVLKLDNPALLFYNKLFYYVINPWSYKRAGSYAYVRPEVGNLLKNLTLETTSVRFRYAGKAYRISKKKKVLVLTLHYPTFKYVVWRNIKLYHRRKKKKIFKFKMLTSTNMLPVFYFNMFKLRIPDTYTRRGILNNMFAYSSRKQRAATQR